MRYGKKPTLRYELWQRACQCHILCHSLFQGQTKERNFGEMRMKQCPTESFARDYFKKHGVEHYWDQAYSGAVLEATEIV